MNLNFLILSSTLQSFVVNCNLFLLNFATSWWWVRSLWRVVRIFRVLILALFNVSNSFVLLGFLLMTIPASRLSTTATAVFTTQSRWGFIVFGLWSRNIDLGLVRSWLGPCSLRICRLNYVFDSVDVVLESLKKIRRRVVYLLVRFLCWQQHRAVKGLLCFCWKVKDVSTIGTAGSPYARTQNKNDKVCFHQCLSHLYLHQP